MLSAGKLTANKGWLLMGRCELKTVVNKRVRFLRKENFNFSQFKIITQRKKTIINFLWMPSHTKKTEGENEVYLFLTYSNLFGILDFLLFFAIIKYFSHINRICIRKSMKWLRLVESAREEYMSKEKMSYEILFIFAQQFSLYYNNFQFSITLFSYFISKPEH